MKYIAIPTIALVLFSVSTSAYAENLQTGTTVTVEQEQSTANTETRPLYEGKKPSLPAFTTMMKNRAGEMKATTQAAIAERSAEFTAKREETKATIEARMVQFQAKRAEIKRAIDARKAELKTKLQEIKKERLSVRKEFVYGRFVSTAAIITSHQTRVARMLEKMKTAGTDISTAEAALKVSVDALAKAQTLLATLKSAQAATETESANLKAIALNVEVALKESRLALIKALDIIAPETTSTTATAE